MGNLIERLERVAREFDDACRYMAGSNRTVVLGYNDVCGYRELLEQAIAALKGVT